MFSLCLRENETIYTDPQPPINVMAVQESPTSIQVSWTPSPSVRDTTGYRIEYTTSGGSSDSVTVSGHTTTHLLEGLQSGETYTIYIITISNESTSDPSVVVIHLNVTGHINAILRRHPLIITSCMFLFVMWWRREWRRE